jgi:hypothetical protein
MYMSAIRDEGSAIALAPIGVRGDRAAVLVAVAAPHDESGDAVALAFASEELQRDRDVVMLAVSNTGISLEHASTRLQADRAVVLVAVGEDGTAIRYAAAKLQGDVDVMVTAMAQTSESWSYISAPHQRKLRSYVDVSLRNLDRFTRTFLVGMLPVSNAWRWQTSASRRFMHEKTSNDWELRQPCYLVSSDCRWDTSKEKRGSGTRNFLSMLNRDEETTTFIKKLIADYAGVLHGAPIELLRLSQAHIDDATTVRRYRFARSPVLMACC